MCDLELRMVGSATHEDCSRPLLECGEGPHENFDVVEDLED